MVCRPNLYARGTDWPGKRTSLWTVECKEAYGLYTFLPVLNLVLSAFENLSLTSGLFFFLFVTLFSTSSVSLAELSILDRASFTFWKNN